MKDKSLGIVCCYFNPCGYHSKLENFKTFYNNIKKQIRDVVVVEIDSKMPLPEEVESIKLSSNSIVWHKETLLNIGIKHLLSQGYENIAWLDADIIFQDGSWVKDTINCLKKYNLCQLFSKAERLTNDGSSIHPGCARHWQSTGNVYPFGTFFHTGYAWAARSDCLSQCNLYEKAILGGGDSLIWLSSFLNQIEMHSLFEHHPVFKLKLEHYISDILDWSQNWANSINGKVSCIYNNILALSHGYNDNRNYVARYLILEKFQYNPKKDIKYEDGLISCINKGLELEIQNYFTNRKEDKFLFLSKFNNFVKSLSSKLQIHDINKQFSSKY